MNTLTLTNTSGRMRTFVLEHDAVCQGGCACEQSRDARVPQTLTLAAGARVAGLARVVLTVPAVLSAVRRGELVVVEDAAPSSPPPPPPPTPPTGRSRKRGAS
jgi:hypothetical protein